MALDRGGSWVKLLLLAMAARPAGARIGPQYGGLQYSDPPPNGTFPWPADYRDPNDQDAWTGGEKALFVLIYVFFWASVCVAVHFWPSLRRFAGRRRAAAARSIAPATQPNSERGIPLLEAQPSEVNVGPRPSYPSDKRVFELFEDCARTTPAAVALLIPDAQRADMRTKTYSELSALIEEVAESLLSVDVSLGRVAALVFDRSVAQVVAIYGTLKAGAAFLPVDADAPLARKQFLLVESEAGAVLGAIGDEATSQLASEVRVANISLPVDGVLGGVQVQRPRAPSTASFCRVRSRSGSWDASGGPGSADAAPAGGRPEASDMALLIYTSGTTGTPKGIVYDHRHLAHGVHFFGEQCKMDSRSVAMLKSPYFWAVIEWEMFPALTRRGKLVVTTASGHKSPEYMVKTTSAQQVSVLMVTPQVLDLLLDIHEAQRSAKLLDSLKHIVTVGEPLPCALANRAVCMGGVQADLHNFYGASESSCAVYTVPRPSGINLALFPNKAPAGLPQPHASVYVMPVEASQQNGARPELVPVPTGEAGEICFGGVLAVGYWKHAELTDEKWIDTEKYGRLYRTGDLGRWRGGVLEVIGRTDRQVKIRGVRVEPEEVEAVLKKLVLPAAEAEAAGSVSEPVQRAALKEVSVVASREPCELVAFVSSRVADGEVTVDILRAHCIANLTPSYVPKFFAILPALPRLPNGKPNLAELRDRATSLATEEGELVMDSLGQMKKLSKWALFENEVIHRCYAYWMIGVLTDHYMHCALDQKSDSSYYPFCTVLARKAVKPWTEVMVRAFGNDQDMFGFIMLGAYQDSRPEHPGQPPRVNLGLKDAFVFLVYMAMAMPLPQIFHFIFRSWAWPHSWGDNESPEHKFGWDYMKVNSYTSDHRWYLEMVLEARIFMQICEKLRIPGWVQGLVATALCLLPDEVFEGKEYAFDICELNGKERASVPTYVQYTFSWLFRNWGDGCAIYWRWIQWYFAFYVWCFHYLRPLVNRVQGRLPKHPTWAAASLGTSMIIGVLMAMFHYPNNVLEDGTGLEWAWLEVGVDIIQPVLFVLGMTYVPLNLAWWGNTTLGCYVFHFYFKDHMSQLTLDIASSFEWDPTGLVLFVVILAMCLLITSVLGPLGHYLLLSPSLLYARLRRIRSSAGRQAREARV